MRAKSIRLVMAILISVLWILPVYSQEDMTHVDASVFDNPRRPSAVFEHDAHNEIAQIEDCAECHHVYDEEGNKIEDEDSTDQRCFDCHEMRDTESMPGLRRAFHLNCKGCHQDQKAGPVMCGKCHIRE